MPPKNPAAVSLGRKGGKATAKNRTPEERAEAARKAVEARWAKQKKLAAEITAGTKKLLKIAKANARHAKACKPKAAES
jgi:general stress protein YciG